MYAAISATVWGDSVLGEKFDEITDLAGFGKDAAVGLFQHKRADEWFEFLLSGGFGAESSYKIMTEEWEHREVVTRENVSKQD